MSIVLAAVAALAFTGSAAPAAQTNITPEHSAVVQPTVLDPETVAETTARVRREGRERRAAIRRARLRRRRPFVYPDGSRWAVPYPIAWCESGGNYFVGPYGAYGLILEPKWMSPREQDEAALRLYREMGDAPWAPYEQGCAYR